MDNESKHGADAHVPSDTEGFDNKVTEMRRKPDDTKKQKPLTPEREKLNIMFQLLSSRLSSFANFFCKNEEQLGPYMMQIQTNVQGVVTNSQLMALSMMLMEKLGALSRALKGFADSESSSSRSRYMAEAAAALDTSENELFERTIPIIEDFLSGLQQQFDITITAEKVTVNERPEQTSAPTSKPGPADHQAGA